MQVGMEHVGNVEVFIHDLGRGRVDYKLFVKPVAARSHGISLCYVLQCYRLWAVCRPYPVGVGQIDAYGSSRERVTAESGGSDYLGAHTFDLGFAEFGVYRAIVFKPLRVVTDNFSAFRRRNVFEVNIRLPAGSHAQRVAIAFYKAVYKVYLALSVFCPKDWVFVKLAQVAGNIVVYQRCHISFLGIVFGIFARLGKIIYDLGDSRAV